MATQITGTAQSHDDIIADGWTLDSYGELDVTWGIYSKTISGDPHRLVVRWESGSLTFIGTIFCSVYVQMPPVWQQITRK